MRNDYLALPHHKQEQDYTCIPACVRMVLAYYGQAVSEADAAALLGTTPRGTLFRRIADIGQLGFAVQVRAGTLEDLRRLTSQGAPCIARIRTTHLPRYPLPPWAPHTVVVAGIAADHVFYFDPAQEMGPDTVPLNLFDAAWMLGQHQFASLQPAQTQP